MMVALPKARLAYLCFEGLPKTVFESQVIGFLKAMAAQSLIFDLFIFESLQSAVRNRSANAKRLAELRRVWGGKVFHIPLGTKYEFPLAALLFLLSLVPDLRRGRRLVLHCRGQYSAFLAALLKKLFRDVLFVYDVRGDNEAEFLYRTAGRNGGMLPWRKLELGLLRWAEGFALRNGDRILCVSSALRGRLQERWGLEGKVIDVIPCCADPGLFHFDNRVRTESRRRLNLEGRVVLVYSGSMYRWQLIERIVEVARHLSAVVPNFHFLCLTPDLAEATSSLATGLSPGSYTLLHVPYSEMPGYLMAGDMGALIRENHPLNQVACPTKFAEYIMCGLPVLITEGLGDLPELVKRERLGIVMKGLDDLAVIEGGLVGFLTETSSPEWKTRTARIGREHFAWDAYASLLGEIYEKASSVTRF
jgi:glycosyltransferase involved in cell wall biosynthesis